MFDSGAVGRVVAADRDVDVVLRVPLRPHVQRRQVRHQVEMARANRAARAIATRPTTISATRVPTSRARSYSHSRRTTCEKVTREV